MLPGIRGKASRIIALAVLSIVPQVVANGAGLISAGRWFSKPPCAHACRMMIGNSALSCIVGNPPDFSKIPAPLMPVNFPVNPPECYLTDPAFLRTLALCIDDRCTRDGIPLSTLEKFWEGHVATGTRANWALRPNASYQETLLDAMADVAAISVENVPYSVFNRPLNVTSFVREEEVLPYWNGAKWVEEFEKEGTVNSLAVAISSVAIPILLSLLRFLPGRSRWYNQLVNILEKPLLGHRHRTPVVANLGIMPTRGQALYITYLLASQIFLAIFPINTTHPNMVSLNGTYPNSYFMNSRDHYFKIIGDRTGIIAMADFLALFLFATRNNIMLWVTDWSHGTFLLLHRWIGYCAIVQIVLHSLILLVRWYPLHDIWVHDPFWIWGIVGTLAAVLLYPSSILPVRQKAYEAFLAFHQVFAALTLIGTYMHIWVFFKHNYGYEIWVYIGGGIWALDRALRLARVLVTGYRTAVVTAIDKDGEYLRIEVDGVVASGNVYLYFPTLSWRLWENHPYSVLSTFAGNDLVQEKVEGPEDVEKTDRSSSTLSHSSVGAPVRSTPRLTILMRKMEGTTVTLSKRVVAARGHLTLPILVEGSYHSNPAIRKFEHCSTLLCIAGGVGITGVLQTAKSFGGVRTRLVWGVRDEALLRSLEPEFASLNPRTVQIQTSVGARLPIAHLLKEELERGDGGDLAVLVCGPPGMADEVRMVVAEYKPIQRKRGVVFVDDAFGW